MLRALRSVASSTSRGGRRRPVEHQESAGGLVVWGSEILLIAQLDGRRWQLPKGHVECGETLEQAAEREVEEETGVRGRVVSPLPSVQYSFTMPDGRRVHKVVHYYLLEYLEGDIANYDPAEVSGAAWFSWQAGQQRLTFRNEQGVVKAARALCGEPMVRRRREP